MAEKKVLKKKKKHWYSILATKDFNNVELGETLAFEDSALMGRQITANLSVLTNDIKTQNVKLSFKVNKVDNGKAYTEVIGYKMVPAFIKRIVRTQRSKLDDSFKIKTQDGVKIILKPVIVTRNKTNKKILTSLRKSSRNSFQKLFEKLKYEDFVKDLIYHKTQKDMKHSLKKVYPVSAFEIKIMKKL
ncbi:hypothetical protein K8R47_00195 [archaeon]|nr:hypothetical protein [archaeon]